MTARPSGVVLKYGDARGRDVEGAALQRGDALGDELLAAIDQPRLLGAVLQGAPRDLVVVGFVRLPEVRGVGVRDRALLPHPVERRAGVETSGEGDADFLPAGRLWRMWPTTS